MASAYLLDTNVLVHLIRGDTLGESIQKRYNLRAFYTECLVSVVTWRELKKLGRSFNWDNRKLTIM